MVALLPWFGSAPTGAAEPTPTLVLSDDAAYVVDLRTKLAWPRCAEGMQWNGNTCTGEPLLMTHAEALAWVATRAKADGIAWRLPRATELRRLVNTAAKGPPLDPALFPAAPATWHWAVTSSVDTRGVNPYEYGNIVRGRTKENANHLAYLHGWAVNLGTGEARGDVTKRSKLAVRLVWPQD